MATQANSYITPEQYLEMERMAETRSEDYRGEVFAMGGASWEHGLIVNNRISELMAHLRGSECKVQASNLRLLVSETGLFTYPDVMVICGKPILTDAHCDTLRNPVLVVEVLSKNTEDYDRGGKFHQYMRLPSVKEYLTVSQTERLVDQHLRQDDGSWLIREIGESPGKVKLKSVGVELSFDQIYEGVELKPY